MHRIGVLLVALLLALLSAPPAVAIEPPAIDPAAVPPDETGPDQPTEQRRVCSAPTVFPNSNFADKPWANDYLRIGDAQKFATGAGVTVAVIDTGVNGSPRVPAEPGGDFVDKARQRHVRLRLRTGRSPRRSSPAGPRPPTGSSASRPTRAFCRCARRRTTFSRSVPAPIPTIRTPRRRPARCAAWPAPIVHAANIGAQVINISEAACYKVTRPIDETGLGAAIDYAVNVKGAVDHRRGRQHRAGLHPEPATRSGDTGRPARLEAGADDRLAGLVLAAGADGRRHRPERAAEQLLDVRPVGRAPRHRPRTSSRWVMTAIR